MLSEVRPGQRDASASVLQQGNQIQPFGEIRARFVSDEHENMGSIYSYAGQTRCLRCLPMFPNLVSKLIPTMLGDVTLFD